MNTNSPGGTNREAHPHLAKGRHQPSLGQSDATALENAPGLGGDLT